MPEMAVQERYYAELDRGALMARYGQSLDGVQAYVEETITDEAQQKKALNVLQKIRVTAARNPAAYRVSRGRGDVGHRARAAGCSSSRS